jgi:hypothetical protein
VTKVMKKAASKPKRFLLDDYFWDIFVEACGGRCLACRKTNDLQRGHVQRHADGGDVSLENMMPLCASCNGKNNQGYNMSDLRPLHWRSQFMKLLARQLCVKLVVTKVATEGSGDCTGVSPKNSIETKEVIDWDSASFEHDLYISTPLPHTPSAPQLPLREVLAAVDELINAGENHPFSIPAPKPKCLNELKRLVSAHGSKNFLAAGYEYIRREKWFDAKGFRIGADPWERFAGGFDRYLALAREWASFKAKQAAEDRERAITLGADAIEREKRVRSDTYRRVSAIRYPGMPEGDREFISAMVCGAKDEVLSVSTEDFLRIEEIEARYRNYQRTSKKRVLLNVLDRLGAEFLSKGLKLSREHGEECFQLRKLLNRASDNGPELTSLEQRVNTVAKQQHEATVIAQKE